VFKMLKVFKMRMAGGMSAFPGVGIGITGQRPRPATVARAA
jgi:hypothetical protein